MTWYFITISAHTKADLRANFKRIQKIKYEYPQTILFGVKEISKKGNLHTHHLLEVNEKAKYHGMWEYPFMESACKWKSTNTQCKEISLDNVPTYIRYMCKDLTPKSKLDIDYKYLLQSDLISQLILNTVKQATEERTSVAGTTSIEEIYYPSNNIDGKTD